MKLLHRVLVLTILILSLNLQAQDSAPVRTLITNVSIFDGTSERLIEGRDVLIEGNLIAEIGRNLEAGEGVTVIDGGGGTLTILAHA